MRRTILFDRITLLFNLRRKKQTKKKRQAETLNILKQSSESPLLSTIVKKPTMFQEIYPIYEPYVYAAIIRDKETQKIRYEILEPTLDSKETIHLTEIKTLLMDELDINMKEMENKTKAEKYLRKKIKDLIKKYRLKIPVEAIDKLTYYIIRDFIGYGKIDALMKDPLIEDISTDGVNIPLYVWHRVYESLPSNIVYKNETELNSFVVRLAYLSGKNVSIASPILDASLPDGSRIQITYGKEITRRGSTFTIRRFKADPLSISDLIKFNTISSKMAAYLWFLIENRASVMVSGGIACGKTTTLNSLSIFIKPEMKIVSVEDTQEINLPHENWIPSVVRTGFKVDDKQSSTITLFDLLKAAVRQRPDYIIVGEVRGEEAYTLFQAMATGHLGMCTIHGESVESVINRLESEPMNIPRTLVAMTDIILIMERTQVNGKPARRVRIATEIHGIGKHTNEILKEEVFTWNPKFDKFSSLKNSPLLEKHKSKMGLKDEDVDRELRSREIILDWMVKKGIRNQLDVANVVREYYVNPKRVIQKARMGLK